MTDYAAIERAAMADLNGLLRSFLPNVTERGSTFMSQTRAGTVVVYKNGFWSDNRGGENVEGRDIVGLYAHTEKCSRHDAAHTLATALGIAPFVAENVPEDVPVMPVDPIVEDLRADRTRLQDENLALRAQLDSLASQMPVVAAIPVLVPVPFVAPLVIETTLVNPEMIAAMKDMPNAVETLKDMSGKVDLSGLPDTGLKQLFGAIMAEVERRKNTSN
jgi:hypothetical protein